MTLLDTPRIALVSGLLLATAPAQSIAWGPVDPSLAAADVSLNGTLVAAHNLRGNAATVNGVAFQGGFQPTDWNGFVTSGLSTSTTGDAGYDELLATAHANASPSTPPAANPSNWGAVRIDNLAPLVPGNLYEVQVWYTDQRPGNTQLYDRVMTLSSAWGNATLVGGEITNLGSMIQGPLSGPLEADPDNAPAVNSPDTVFGSHCTGTFLYIPGGETYLMVQGTHPIATNNLRPHLNAFQIRDLSGPSWTSYGSACARPAGPLALQLVSLPALGGTFALDVNNVGSGLVIMAMGLTQTNTPLPLPIFVPGCTQLTSLDFTQVLAPSGGVASWSVQIPSNAAFAGLQVFNQAAELAALVSLSNGGAGVIR